jgi:hypothetical protein
MRPVEFVVAARLVEPYVLEVTFDDGVRRRVDMEPMLWKPVFAPLQDPDFFAKFEVDPILGTVVWPNGADVSPEFLYYGEEGPPPGYYDPQEEPEDEAEDEAEEVVPAGVESR